MTVPPEPSDGRSRPLAPALKIEQAGSSLLSAASWRPQLFRRYRLPLALALPSGAAGGALIGVALFLTSSADVRAGDRAAGWLLYTVGLGAGVGAAVAAAAAAGAVLTVLLHARRDHSTVVPLSAVAGGAALGVLVVVVGLGCIITPLTHTGWSALFAWFTAAALVAALSAGLAALITAVTLRKQPDLPPAAPSAA